MIVNIGIYDYLLIYSHLQRPVLTHSFLGLQVVGQKKNLDESLDLETKKNSIMCHLSHREVDLIIVGKKHKVLRQLLVELRHVRQVRLSSIFMRSPEAKSTTRYALSALRYAPEGTRSSKSSCG